MFAVAALATCGVFAIYSVTWFRFEDPYLFTLRQVIWLILAALVLSVVMSLDYHWLKERAMFFYGCTLLVLGLTLFGGHRACRAGAFRQLLTGHDCVF